VIRCIIEFAKAVDVFRRLSQTDQIILLKRSTFEMAVIAVAPHYNMETNVLTLNNQLFPVTFFSSQDPGEAAFGNELITCLRMLAAFQLTTTEIALLSGYVLLKASEDEQLFVSQLKHCLAAQLSTRYSDVDEAMHRLFDILPRLRDLSKLHVMCLSRFREALPENFSVELPPLYSELFSTEV